MNLRRAPTDPFVLFLAELMAAEVEDQLAATAAEAGRARRELGPCPARSVPDGGDR